MSWHSLQWTWYLSHNINQLPGTLGPPRFRSLKSMACEGAKCSAGFLWLPGALHCHTTCNPGDFSRLPHQLLSSVLPALQENRTKTYPAKHSWVWPTFEKNEGGFQFSWCSNFPEKEASTCPLPTEAQSFHLVGSSFLLIFVLSSHSPLSIPPRRKSLAPANPQDFYPKHLTRYYTKQNKSKISYFSP